MKNLRHILLLLTVVLLAACSDKIDYQSDYQEEKDHLPDPHTYISFATRAPAIEDDSWMLLPLPGQSTNTVQKGNFEYEVPQNFGVFGYYTDDDASNVTEPETPVFGKSVPDGSGGYTTQSDILEQYDKRDEYLDDERGNVNEEEIESRRKEIFDKQNEQFERAAGEIRVSENGDSTVHYSNGTVERMDGTVITEGSTDVPDTPVFVDAPYGTRINEDGSVEMADGTKISKDGTLYRTIKYKMAVEGAVAEEEKSVEVNFFPNGGYEIKADGTTTGGDVPEDFVNKVEESDITTFTFIDGTVMEKRTGQTADTPIVIISFTMKTADGASVHVDYSCSDRMLNFNPGENSQNIDLGSIWDGMNQNSGDQSNPAKPRFATRADANYNDQDDKYFYGYEYQRWKDEDYMFYGYAPASANAKIKLDADGAVGSFTWDKIPCVSTTDFVVAKEEVWRKNKSAATADLSRIHFDDMQHLMSRVRLYFAVHKNFHKIRRVVVTQASLSFQEEGFKKVYKFENSRTVDNLHGKTSWTWTADPNYVYNPKYNTAFYSSLREAHPSDMVVYQNRADATGVAHYGKLLKPLPATGWGADNLFTDFFIVPYEATKTPAKEMKLHVKYNIYDTDPEVKNETVTEDGHTMLYYSNGHLIRECQRESTITFKTPMLFQSGVSHALKIVIDPDYIYVLSDHDEPIDGDVIVP